MRVCVYVQIEIYTMTFLRALSTNISSEETVIKINLQKDILAKSSKARL